MINVQFIRDKLEHIKLYYQDLEKLFTAPLEEIEKDFIKYYAAERLLQLLVDEVLDINNHIISRQNLPSPDDFQSTFQILANNQILPEDFVQRFAPVVGLRNRLVHRYETIDKELVLKQIQKEKSDFVTFIQLIEQYLEKQK